MKTTIIAALPFLVAALLGCDSNDPASDANEISRIQISTDSVLVGVGEEVDFSVTALTASGDEADPADYEVRWWSTDTTVFKVDDSGLAVGEDVGTGYCMVEVTSLSKAARFTGRDSAFVRVMLF